MYLYASQLLLYVSMTFLHFMALRGGWSSFCCSCCQERQAHGAAGGEGRGGEATQLYIWVRSGLKLIISCEQKVELSLCRNKVAGSQSAQAEPMTARWDHFKGPLRGCGPAIQNESWVFQPHLPISNYVRCETMPFRTIWFDQLLEDRGLPQVLCYLKWQIPAEGKDILYHLQGCSDHFGSES